MLNVVTETTNVFDTSAATTNEVSTSIETTINQAAMITTTNDQKDVNTKLSSQMNGKSIRIGVNKDLNNCQWLNWHFTNISFSSYSKHLPSVCLRLMSYFDVKLIHAILLL